MCWSEIHSKDVVSDEILMTALPDAYSEVSKIKEVVMEY